MKKFTLTASAAILMIACSAETGSVATAADSQSKPVKTQQSASKSKPSSAPLEKLTTKDLGNNIHVIMGPGGNVGLSVGDDGALIIDDKFERHGPQIIEIAGTLTTGKIRYVLNTHHHGDHTGGNAVLADTGAVVVAHDNVRKRLVDAKADQPGLWPKMTFSDTATFYFNGQTIDIMHVPSAHTDGDSLIYFQQADIAHLGDNYFNGMFPFVDVDSGGSMQGMINAQEKALAMINADTTIIPGHGPIASREDLQKSVTTLKDIQARIKKRVDAGDSVDAIVEAGVLSDYKNLSGFINEERMVRSVYRSLTGK